MFSDFWDLWYVEISDWRTNNVIDMSHMFENDQCLTHLYLNNWNTSNVTNMSYMFSYVM